MTFLRYSMIEQLTGSCYAMPSTYPEVPYRPDAPHPAYKLGRGCDQDREMSLSSLPSIMVKGHAGFSEMDDCSPTLAELKYPPVSGRSWLSQTVVHPRRHPTWTSQAGLMMWHVEIHTKAGDPAFWTICRQTRHLH
ncbi:hypothetical protein F5X99DRAFT_292418 [Biscogniauxia marginata]|nr:hypothetical protein F5X99DRAFT_292418 [Biscogniauxia marginata]